MYIKQVRGRGRAKGGAARGGASRFFNFLPPVRMERAFFSRRAHARSYPPFSPRSSSRASSPTRTKRCPTRFRRASTWLVSLRGGRRANRAHRRSAGVGGSPFTPPLLPPQSAPTGRASPTFSTVRWEGKCAARSAGVPNTRLVTFVLMRALATRPELLPR